jgi:Spy/CpxP family protein refolding chaperone
LPYNNGSDDWSQKIPAKEKKKMKKIATTLSVLVLVGVLAVPVWAYRGGWGGGSGGPGSCRQGAPWNDNLTEEQRGKLDNLEKEFFKETAELRRALWTKSDELQVALSETEPDVKKVKSLQAEISTLRGKMAEKRIDVVLAAKKIAPESGYGRGFGKGLGPHMKGPGGQRGGNGPGPCWE